MFIFSAKSEINIEQELREKIKNQAKTVIILNKEIPHRWLIDADFKITYRQNDILIFQKTD